MSTVAYIKQKDEGRRMVIALCEEGDEVRRLNIRAETYAAIGCPVRGQVIDDPTLQLIEREDACARALRYALYLLSFADNSERQLLRKLAAKGYDREAAAFAVREAVQLGYVREGEQVRSLVRMLANTRLYGPRRITAALTAKGYRASDIRAAMDALTSDGEVDFSRNLRLLEDKKGDGTPECRRKLQYTYGYRYEE